MKTVIYDGQRCEVLWQGGQLVQIMYEGLPTHKAKHLLGGKLKAPKIKKESGRDGTKYQKEYFKKYYQANKQRKV